MKPRRRALVLAGATLPLLGCGQGPVKGFATLASARAALKAVDPAQAHSNGAWSLAQVFNHAAQSIEFSLAGFPQLKSALFRHTVGAAAWAVFDARGAMNHSLSEPIPGAPALDAKAPLDAAIARLQVAIDQFEAHRGALSPHFAYGALDKPAYTRAHLMHLANHWSEITLNGVARA